MHLRFWRPVLILALSFLFLGALQLRAAAPTITSLSVTSGAVGASVTITGTNFGSTQGTSTVTFNGTTATVTTWTTTSIVTTVPTGATTGNVVVTVSRKASNGESFTVVAAPSITSLSITTGAVGAAVTITGTNFGSSQGSGTVKFNGTAATVTSWSATSIGVTVPSGATTGNVVVFASGVNSNGSSFTVVPAPSITSLSTTSGPVGTAVTIAGTNFGSPQGSGTVSFNGAAASVTSWSATSVAVTVPSAATTGNVVVFASGVNSNGSSFTVTPDITSLSITSGAVGASVTITGTTFGSSQGSSTVKFNGTAATATTWSSTSIVTTVPSGATTGNVVVTVSSNASNGVSFTVVPAPSITSLSITTGAVGAAVTITGTNFGSSQGSSTVKFNGTAASVTSWAATSIAVTVPSGATTGNVVVFASGVNSNGSSFTVVAAPSITSLSITTGAVGAAVTITGTNFGSSQGSSTVKFNGTAATVTSWSATSIGVTVPSGATTGNVVVFASGVNSNGSSFTVVAAPSITSLSITTGAVGAAVTITGTNFGSSQGSGTVSFNGTAASVTSWSATSIGVTVPSGATTGNVVVFASGVNSNGVNFTVLPTPSITSLSPASGNVGTLVTVTGTNFGSPQGTSTVTFNGTTATPTSWSATSIVTPVPAGAQTGNVVVTVSGVASNGSSFTVFVLPGSWLDQDIGAVGLAGSASFANGTFTVNASGLDDIDQGATDVMNFLYLPLSGDGTVIARVVGAQAASFDTQAGVMIRETLTGGSTNALAGGYDIYQNDADFLFWDRPTTGGSATNQGIDGGQAVPLPYWFKVVRSGSTFTGYQGPDGVNWDQIGSSQSISMAQSVYIGLGVSGGNSSTLSTATFDNVSISTPSAPAPSISTLSATTGPVGTQVVISGSGFGASQSSSVVTLNAVPVTVNSWSATSITVTIPTGATTGPLLVSVAPNMNDSNYVIFTVTSQPLPSGWLDMDIGLVGARGSATFANGTFTVNASGLDNIDQSRTDSFHFVYQPLSGDGTIVARVVGAQPGTVSAQAGVVIREALDAGSAGAFAGAFDIYQNGGQNDGYFVFLDRPTEDGTTTSQSNSPGVGIPLPYWFKIVRSGSTIASYQSPDGQNWDQIGSSQGILMPQIVYIGLGASGGTGSNSSLSTVTFDSVSFSSDTNPAPVISGLSATSGPVGTQVVISGSGFGASQGNSVATLNALAVTINSWSDTSITVTIPTGATTGPMLVSVAPSMNDSNCVTFVVTSQPLPSPWLDQDIGDVGLAGSATYASGTFTVNAAGNNGIDFATSDQMHFVYQSFSGNGTFVARVVTLTGNSNPQAGIVVRETLDANSASAFAGPYGTTTSAVIYFNDRPSTGANPTFQNISGGTSLALPYWVKLVRSGNMFSGYQSPDGVTWTQIGTSQTVTMVPNVYVGLAVSSHSSTNLATATFDNVTSTFGASTSTPLVTGVTPSAGGVGVSVTISGVNFGVSQGNSTVNFNGISALVTDWRNSEIIAVVPTAATTGAVTVVVNSVVSNSDITYTVINPVINTLSPPEGPIGGSITLNGSGFGASQSGNTAQFNGATAAVSSWSNTSITATVPSNATTGPVTVTVGGVISDGVTFTVTGTLAVTGVSPGVGPVGTSVTITGTGFGTAQNGGSASFNGTVASITSWSATQIVAVVPSGTATGPVSVTVASITAYGPTYEINSTIQLTDSLGNQSSYTSEMVGGKWYVSQAQGSGCSSCTVRGNRTNQYDNFGNVLSATDELGRVTTYTYDSNDNLTSIVQPAVGGSNPTTTYTYNSFGEVLTMTDPLGNVTTNTYDSHGNLTSVTSPPPNSSTPSSVTQFAYNSLGEMTQITDPLSRITKLTYTSAGLIATITDPQQNVTTYQYDSRGNRTSITDAMQNQTTFAYDTGDRLTTITYPGGTTTTTFTYDYRGRRITATDQNGKTTTYAYDDEDRITSVTDAATNVTQYAYDTENNLLTITDANLHATTFAYDAFGRVTQTTFPSNLFETYAYDAANNLTSKTDRKNQTIQYVYDALNRLTQKSYPDTTSVNYIYDLASKIQQVNDPTGTYGFTYDNMGRLTGTSTQYAFLTGTFTNAYSYDANSNRTGFTAPDGSTNTYSYDTLNRLNTLANSWAGSFGFSYDALNRRTQMTRPNNIATNYSYDNQSRLISVLHQLSGSTIDGASYTVDPAGNRTAKTDQLANVTSNYGYDSIYELTGVTQGANTTESYTFDPVGNRLSSLGVSPYSYNSSNELTAQNGVMYTYDSNGNTLTKVDSTGTTNYTWDFENRLTSVVLPGTGGTDTFKYDPLGRRVQKSFTQNSSTTTTNYIYDGGDTIQETDQNANVLARYSRTANIDELLAELRSATTSFYEQDGLGSVTSLSTTAGALADAYTFDSFGKQTASSGSLVNPFRLTGREFDSEANLYFYRARYYDPVLGRFLSEDPIHFRGGIDFYTYVKNRPILLRDPSGRACWGGGLSGSGAFSAFWFGAGVEGSFYFVADGLGNQGVLDCSAGGVGAVSGVGGSVGLSLPGIFSPNCRSICELQGGFGGITAWAGAGLTKNGGASVSTTTGTFNAGAGLGVGAGAGVVAVGGDCILIWKHHNCPICPLAKR
jgi:RHS repeat-associated protein